MQRDRNLDEDVLADVELAEKGPDFERRIGEVAGVGNRPTPAEVERAEEDVLLGEVDDKGHGSRTFIAKGDPITAGLRELPRRAARPAPPKR
jgi:hypothetical protein